MELVLLNKIWPSSVMTLSANLEISAQSSTITNKSWLCQTNDLVKSILTRDQARTIPLSAVGSPLRILS